MATMSIKATITIEEEPETPSPETEAADLQASTIKASIQALLHHSLNNSKTSNLSLHLQGNQKDLLAKSVGHYAIDCYHRMNFANQGKNPTTKLATMANASNI